MIEKIKDFLYLDECDNKEVDGFSIIIVYPYLSFNNKLEEDEKRAIDYSHHLKHCNYVISVRSKEAQLEIGNILESNEFYNKPIEDCFLNLCESELNKIEYPLSRSWFNIAEYNKTNAMDYMVSKSGLGLKVFVPLERLSEFRDLIKNLRTTKYYRNLWEKDDKFILG